MTHSLGSATFLSIFSTNCCSFEVSEPCKGSRSPPNGNLALNCSDISGVSGLVAIGGLLEVVYSILLSPTVLVFVVKLEGWLLSSVFPFEVGKVATSPSSDTPSLLFVEGSAGPESLLAECEGLVMATE